MSVQKKNTTVKFYIALFASFCAAQLFLGCGKDQPEGIPTAKPNAASQSSSQKGLSPGIRMSDPYNLYWGDGPEVIGSVYNAEKREVTNLRFDLKVTDTYYDRQVWTGALQIAAVPAGATVEASTKFMVPYGVHRIDWQLFKNEKSIAQGTHSFGVTLGKCFKGLSKEEEAFMKQTWPFGGVFWQCPPERGRDAGAGWIRNWVDWNQLEPSKGQYDMTQVQKRLDDYRNAGIESTWLLCPSDKTDFYNREQLDFSRAYGNAWSSIAETAKGKCSWFELGNEDNGVSKYLYTENARHGAAAIRSKIPDALIANSGTAFVDLVWMGMQADRGLFDRLDALCVHPYTCSVTPETWKVFDDAKKIQKFIDSIGGMKSAWTTEFGWPDIEVGRDADSTVKGFDQKLRAEWIPRHFLEGLAGGYEKEGLFSWMGHYGIFGDEGPTLSAISTHTLMKLTEGCRFAGFLENKPDQWAVVWEKLGRPVFVAWSPTGSKRLKVPVGDFQVQVLDLFGNPLPMELKDGWLWMNLTSSPQYLINGPRDLVEYAWMYRAEALRTRFADIVKDTPLVEDPLYKKIWDIKSDPGPTSKDIWEAIQRAASGKEKFTPNQQTAIEASLLRLLTQGARMGLARELVEDPTEEIKDFEQRSQEIILQAASQDLEIPALRWALNEFKTLDTERQMTQAKEDLQLTGRLLIAEGIMARFARELIIPREDARKFTAVWPYLYMLDKNGNLKEKLHFIPGVPTAVKIRVNSYASKDYSAKVSIEAPKGWVVKPGSQIVQVPAGKDVTLDFEIQCLNDFMIKPSFTAMVEVAGKPKVTIPFDDTEISFPVRVTQEPSQGLLPQTPLRLKITNVDVTEQTGSLSLYQGAQPNPVASALIANITPEASVIVELTLPPTAAKIPFQEWPFALELTLKDARKLRQEFKPSFACAIPASKPPVIDGDLSDWSDAAPFHLDREEFTSGTFSGKWKPEDLSATGYLMWDKNCVYFAAKVKDSTFNQQFHGDAIWMQDSVQLAIARDANSKASEFGLALTTTGEEVFQLTPTLGMVAGALLKTSQKQGEMIYEASIPWATIKDVPKPEPGMKIRVAWLVNDDDVVVGRRFLETPGGGIAHDKAPANFMEIVLLGE